ncbi:class I SAM-dependent methyltransferase [Avibacterium paragallinarum]|nr:class I SAM-dependent methyltransferase [Acinetobacter sp. YH12052]
MYVDSILAFNPNAHVLELGSGLGYFAEFLINHCPNIDYTAFDFSEAMHDLAKEKLSAEQLLKCNFITGDFKQSNWE